jgi:catechol 2,3-dioxygenase-like lactoylglutathione lyase family enzyme
MAIVGTHTLLYTSEPEALRAVLRDVFGFKYVDAGDGWLIFALPPAEMGIHPAEGPSTEPRLHQIAFICDDIHATVRELRAKGIAIEGEPIDQGWGVTSMMNLPGGTKAMVYEPRHPLAITPTGS